ncbi:hypothetical protein D3C84_1020920 [compost metagenome]
MPHHFALLIVKLGPWPETNAAGLQLVPLAGVEVLEFHVQPAITPQRLGIRADVAGFDGKLITHRQFMAAGLHFEIAPVDGRPVIDF